jgi:hypothetical protein
MGRSLNGFLLDQPATQLLAERVAKDDLGDVLAGGYWRVPDSESTRF